MRRWVEGTEVVDVSRRGASFESVRLSLVLQVNVPITFAAMRLREHHRILYIEMILS
jgi:hypothetical protein